MTHTPSHIDPLSSTSLKANAKGPTRQDSWTEKGNSALVACVPPYCIQTGSNQPAIVIVEGIRFYIHEHKRFSL